MGRDSEESPPLISSLRSADCVFRCHSSVHIVTTFRDRFARGARMPSLVHFIKLLWAEPLKRPDPICLVIGNPCHGVQMFHDLHHLFLLD